jgi:NAD+ synthase
MAEANTRSRLRMVTLYHMAAQTNGIVVGTGNKVEDFGVGFYTKYGDGGVDISPIADLMKSEVYSLGKDLGIVDSIMKAPPTDGLWGDTRTDEEQIGATYEELEWAMTYEEGYSLTNRQQEVLDIYNKFNRQNKHKMEPIPVYKSIT